MFSHVLEGGKGREGTRSLFYSSRFCWEIAKVCASTHTQIGRGERERERAERAVACLFFAHLRRNGNKETYMNTKKEDAVYDGRRPARFGAARVVGCGSFCCAWRFCRRRHGPHHTSTGSHAQSLTSRTFPPPPRTLSAAFRMPQPVIGEREEEKEEMRHSLRMTSRPKCERDECATSEGEHGTVHRSTCSSDDDDNDNGGNGNRGCGCGDERSPV